MQAKRDIIYISGPISADPEGVEAALAKFAKVDADLKAAGYITANPAATKYSTEGMDERAVWQLYMRSAIRQVTTAGGVALLPGWQSSPGAILEVFIANNLGIECQPVAVWIKRAEVKK